MAQLAATVAVVTTLDEVHRPWGFTATSVCSLSLDPPLLLVCLDRRARSHPAFCAADRFAVSLLRSDQQELATRFANGRADKFAGDHIVYLHSGIPAIRGAVVQLQCSTHNLFDGGDHTIVIGRVELVSLSDGQPLVYLNRGFHTR
jgi:flavin reductase ActVB